MTGRSVATGALAVLLTLTVAGCGGGPERPAGSAGPASDTTDPTASATAGPATPAARTLAALQDATAELAVVEVRVATAGSGRVGRRTGVADVRTGDFRASLTLSGGQRLDMIRQADLTWTRAPASYWVRLGYTAASAAAARGRWVVAPADGMKQVADALDPGAVVRSVAELEPEDATALATVRRGPLRGNRVLTFAQPGAVQRVFLTAGTRPHLLRVTSTRAGVTTTVDVAEVSGPLRLRLPAADDVVQPR